MKRIKFAAFIAGVTFIGITGSIETAPRRANPDAKLHRYSTTIEKERPQLNDETKRLIAVYRHDPSEANRAAYLEKRQNAGGFGETSGDEYQLRRCNCLLQIPYRP